MFTIYIYLPDTLADWELGHITAELQSRRFFKKDAPHLELKTVGYCREPVHTMGGLTVVPDCAAGDIATDEKSVLLLPGANTWSDPRHGAIVEKADEFLAAGAAVGAICGATAALAGAGLLSARLQGTALLCRCAVCSGWRSFYGQLYRRTAVGPADPFLFRRF